MTKHLLKIFLGLTLLAGGCAQTPVTENVSAVVPPGSFSRGWKAELDLKGESLTSLYVRENMLIAYTSANRAWVLDRSSGHIVRYDAPTREDDALQPPVLLNDYLIYPTRTTLELYNRLTNARKTVKLGYHIHSQVVAGKGSMVYLGCDMQMGSRVVGVDVDATYAHTIWPAMTFGGVSGSPTIVDQVIYAADETGRIYAITSDGKAAWPQLDFSAFQTTGPIKSPVVADELGVYVASNDGVVYAVDRSMGKLKWRFFANHPLNTAPVATKNNIYQYVPSTGVVCLDKVKGKLAREALWTLAEGVKLLSTDATYAYISQQDGSIAAVEIATGKKAFVSKTTGYTLFVTNTADSMIYAGKADGFLTMIKPVITVGQSGELVMSLEPMPAVAMAQ